MRILLVAVSAPSKMTGVHRHAINLAKCLLRRGEDVDMVIAPWQLESTQDSDLRGHQRFTLHLADLTPGLVSRNLWHCFTLPKLINNSGADIVHLTYPVPILKSLIFRPIVVTLHDLYPFEIPENFGVFKSSFNRVILRLCMRNADAVAAVSSHTLTTLQKYLPGATKKAVRIYNVVESPTTSIGRSPLPNWRGYPFLLCVAQHRRNKNIPLLLRAFHQLITNNSLSEGTRLVIIGVPGPETTTIEDIVRSLHLAESVVFLKGVSEPDLRWCYRNAQALIAPSRTEGFGFPIAEALQAGCRFVCSDIAAFREIGTEGGHTFSFDGDAENNLATAIIRAVAMPAPVPAVLEQFAPNAISSQYTQLYFDLHTRHLQTSAQHAPWRTS